MNIQTRTITREQLEEWGLPYELVGAGDQNPFGVAVELHREQVDMRRWYSVHRLVFQAPDDGQPWAVTYRRGLTERQEDTDEWDDAPEIAATRMERYEKTVTAWRKVGTTSEPAA